MGETQEALQFITDQARRLLTEQATPERLKALLDEAGGFDRELWTKTAELGWCAAAIPEEQGGIGLGWEALCQLSEVLGEFTVSLPLLPNTLLANTLIAAGEGDGDVCTRLLSGEAVATLAITDRGAAGIPAAPAARFGDGRLSGAKAVAPFAAVADFALVSASADDGVAILLVDLGAEGVTREVVNVIDNGRAMAQLSFANTPATRLDGGEGARLLSQLACAAAVVTAFEQVGGARIALDMAVAYAKERKVFGQAIGAFQAIKHNLANMYASIEVARGCALDAMAQLEAGSPALVPYAAAARVGASKAYDFAGKECIQIHGGIGATWEYMPHHYYRRARSLALELGAPSYWRDLLVDNVHMMAEGY
jgi:alkylation response protein AidB-like acyl-CoA dehydrogenase